MTLPALSRLTLLLAGLALTLTACGGPVKNDPSKPPGSGDQTAEPPPPPPPPPPTNMPPPPT